MMASWNQIAWKVNISDRRSDVKSLWLKIGYTICGFAVMFTLSLIVKIPFSMVYSAHDMQNLSTNECTSGGRLCQNDGTFEGISPISVAVLMRSRAQVGDSLKYILELLSKADFFSVFRSTRYMANPGNSWHKLWKENGSLRDKILAEICRVTWVKYHNAIRCVRKDKILHASNRYTDLLCINYNQNFWSSVKRSSLKRIKNGCVMIVHEAVGEEAITKVCVRRYERLCVWIGLIVRLQPLIVILPTASWIRWCCMCMRMWVWWVNLDLSWLGRTIYIRQFFGAKPLTQFRHIWAEMNHSDQFYWFLAGQSVA